MATKLWTVKGDGRHLGPNEVVAPHERLAWGRTVSIGAQHVIAMFGATFLVPILTGFPPTTTIFFSGVGTIIFILMTRGYGQPLGLPSYTGSSFAFISPVIAAKTGGGIGAALCGILAAGAVLFLPAFENFVVAAFGLNSFACVWVFVDLHDTLPPLSEKLGARAL